MINTTVPININSLQVKLSNVLLKNKKSTTILSFFFLLRYKFKWYFVLINMTFVSHANIHFGDAFVVLFLSFKLHLYIYTHSDHKILKMYSFYELSKK